MAPAVSTRPRWVDQLIPVSCLPSNHVVDERCVWVNEGCELINATAARPIKDLRLRVPVRKVAA